MTLATAIESFSINAKNQLVVNKNVTLEDTWSLNEDHNLCLSFDGAQDTGYGDKVILDGNADFFTEIHSGSGEDRAELGFGIRF